MSDIGLLMAGVLATGQTSGSELPQPAIQEDFVVKSTQNQEAKVVPPSDITAPELIQPDESPQAASLALKQEHKKILNQVREKIQSKSQDKGIKEQGGQGNYSSPTPQLSSEEISTPELTPLNPTDETESAMSQITSVSQLNDVQPSDWAFTALQSLVERYGCTAGYPNRTYSGNSTISRYEFAAGVNACLLKINQLVANNTDNAVKQEDLILLQRLQNEFQTELQEVEKRVSYGEQRTDKLQTNQFSPSTRLLGQAIFSAQGTSSGDVYFSPKGGETVFKNKAESNLTFANSVQLTLATSFTGKDLLLTGLSAGNLGSLAGSVSTNMGRLGFESDTQKNIVVNELSYRFPLSKNLGIVVGSAGVNPITTFRGINPLEGSGDGAISMFGQRNPILGIGNGTGGVGFDWQISDRVSLQGVYSAQIPSFGGDQKVGGLFGGKYTTGAQLSLAPTDNIDVGLNYLYSHSPDDLLGSGVGDAQMISIFAPDTDAFDTHAVGATIAWRINPNLQLGGWGGWTYSKPENLSGNVQTTNWAVFAAFPNLFRPGNLGGVLVGQPPKITSSTLPEGYNFPDLLDGKEGGRSDSALHVELFYRAQLTDNLALTPGVFVVFNSNHNAASDPLVVGALRATFRF
ncbi:MAG: iron uptake porin [Cyanomargarita calcarea GSE-NOS-MK-12-04C]|jgi:hypothetical protein|uniref:Iron uptake porin n=1 Tax=Cyanomargarita calcarea GSE-NOS-MK-12-04C TaxID=2839659 RepID=A0A951QRB0_9CYAN|nr:iron uptake porin [Cyanomargarita calcarea GSE-NOS-MK-12-04C]